MSRSGAFAFSALRRLPGDVWVASRCLAMSREALRTFQSRRLRMLVRHAYDEVPFYRRLYREHGVDPREIRGIEDLARLPTISKTDLLAVPERDLVARGVEPEKLIEFRTSGSSGHPMTFRRTWLETRITEAIRMRMANEVGLTPRLRRFGVNVVGAYPRDRQGLLRLMRGLGWFQADSHDGLDDPQRILAALREARPDVVHGMAGLLDRLVRSVGVDAFEGVKARLVYVGGDLLTPAMRRRFEEAFGAPVLETYGSHEFNLIAWECPEGGRLHTTDCGVVVEVLRNGSAAAVGESGEVVVTGLHSWAMPLIRYRHGDAAVRGRDDCPCGRPLGSIERVEGRLTDALPLADGRILHVFHLVYSWWDRHPWVARYQVVQDSLSELRIRIEPSRPPSAEEIEDVRVCTQRAVGECATLTVELTDRIELEAGGKFRLAISRVGSDSAATRPGGAVTR